MHKSAVVAITLCLHTRSEQGIEEMYLLSDVHRCTAERAAKLKQKIYRPPPKEHKKGAGGFNIKFQRGSIAMLHKKNMPKIEQRIIVSGQIFKIQNSKFVFVLESLFSHKTLLIVNSSQYHLCPRLY